MDINRLEYQPAFSDDEAGGYSLYFCPICDQDTLHQVTDVEEDHYDIRCSRCNTTSMTRANFFDAYEEETYRWGQEIGQFLDEIPIDEQ